MGNAVLQIGGRRYEIACRDGDEAHMASLGRAVDAKVQAAAAGMGNLNEVRQLLFAALLLADELGETRAAAGQAPAPAAAPAPVDAATPTMEPELVPLLGALAEHLEAIAGRLEKAPAAA